jgi:hypothetical protein
MQQIKTTTVAPEEGSLKRSGLTAFEAGLVKRSTHYAEMCRRDSEGKRVLLDSPENIRPEHLMRVDVDGTEMYAEVFGQLFYNVNTADDGEVRSASVTIQLPMIGTFYGITLLAGGGASVAGQRIDAGGERWVKATSEWPEWTEDRKDPVTQETVTVVRRAAGPRAIASLSMGSMAKMASEHFAYALPIDHEGLGLTYTPYQAPTEAGTAEESKTTAPAAVGETTEKPTAKETVKSGGKKS